MELRHRTKTSPSPFLAEFAHLEHLAFHGRNEEVFETFKRCFSDDRESYRHKFIILALIQGGIEKLRVARKQALEDLERELMIFLEKALSQFLNHCKETKYYPLELFQSMLIWGEALNDLSYFEDSLHHYEEALTSGLRNYPNLYLKALIKKGEILITLGRLNDAQTVLTYLIERPYLFSDRNLVPEVILNLGRCSLLLGEAERYKELFLQGLRRFYNDFEKRRYFVTQITHTYRSLYRMIFARGVSTGDKMLFFIHRLGYSIHDQKFARYFRIRKLIKWVLLGYIYLLNYTHVESPLPPVDSAADEGRIPIPSGGLRPRNKNSHGPPILVTRAMGGVGDLLMMTPGLHALRKKHPQGEIHFAIPKKYFPLFCGNEDVLLVDIERDPIDLRSYSKWFNLSDCPAARVESKTAPRVKQCRIDIFARAMGIRGIDFLRMERKPRFFLSPEEKEFQRRFWAQNHLDGKTVIAVQLYSAETYRDYPHIWHLINRLSKEMTVMLFHDQSIKGYDHQNVLRIDSFPLRQAFALAAGSNAIIAPDSVLIHLAGALDIPSLALAGPIDGKLRARYYGFCKFLDARTRLGCVPCWRNEYIHCKLTGNRESACMAAISVDQVYTSLVQTLKPNFEKARLAEGVEGPK